jgi:hypothetical protein
MTPNELCENCGFEKYRHNEKEGIVYTGLEPRIYDCSKVCKKFTPKIEKTEVQTICPLGETIPDFTPKIEKTEQEKFKEIKVNSNELYKNMSKENNNHKLSYDEVREGSSSIHLADRKPEETVNRLSSVANSGFSTPDEILINSKGERVKCIYCGKDIHISKFGGINKKGLFCNESFCLLELIKENESGN